MSDFVWGDQLPTFAGPRVVLRPLDATAVHDVFAIFSDAEVMRYRDAVLMRSHDDASAYLAQVDEAFRRRELFEWGIAAAPTGSILGTCTLVNLNATHRRCEIGFALGRAHWGHGFATEAVSVLISFAFERLNLHRLEADVDPRNTRSLRLLERLGFRREGHLRERYHLHGEVQDALVLGLLRSEWRA